MKARSISAEGGAALLRRVAWVAVAHGVFLWGAVAAADIYEDGQILPNCPDQGTNACPPDNCRLQTIFCDRGEVLDVHTDASLVPEIFHPASNLTFTLVAEGAGFENEFGWYNVGDDTSLAANRHVIFVGNSSANNDEPITVRSETFCGNANWKGGPIGFFLVTPEDTGTPYADNNAPGYVFFSEPRLNTQECPSGKIHHLVYESGVTANAFYFGFEDLLCGGDLDYEDTLVLVEGLLVGGPQELCNGLDDDCDGDIDEDVTRPCTTACGTGVEACISADTWGTCSAPSPSPEVCDGVDNDCVGGVDDGLSRQCATACGIGTEVCLDGSYVACSAPTPSPETCDNVDNNCDGQVDEGLTRACDNGCTQQGTETCVAGVYVGCDAPAPTDEVCDGVDNDCDGDIDEDITRGCQSACGTGIETCQGGSFVGCDAPTAQPETCNGVDDNCNGVADEGLTQPCSTICGSGSETCQGGTYVGCTAPVAHPEVCDNIDNDCDGTVDEGLTAPCTTACGTGVAECEAGQWVRCTAPQPTQEICDGIDNDCDGDADEDIARPCSNQCGSGIETCGAGDFVGCDAPQPVTETCNNVDDDCDGATDEGLSQGCSTSCGSGTEFCQGGAWVGCTAPASSAEVCDNIDNDCNGEVDDQLSRACSNACGTGTETCHNGVYVGCSAPEPSAEICDGLDNDCDGATDEGLTRPCHGACGTGVETCTAGVYGGCTAPEPQPEVCDGVDNDCDGLIDQGLSRPCSSACGTGVEFCQGGAWLGCTAPLSQPEVCDNSDNDCDGQTDEDLTRACENGCGAGIERCETGRWIGCSAPPPELEVCDGVDNDCDGVIDDNLTRSCSGVCGIGTETCVAGEFVGCDVALPAEEICDGIDNDCDGTSDEGLARGCESACGSGTETCVAAEWVGCSAPPVEDEACDGVDNNCDGQVDEGLLRECATGCGTGMQGCEGGQWSPCPVPEPEPEVCDGQDNDCDGIVDNGAECEGERETCIDGECVEHCQAGECPAGRVCQDDYCITEPCALCRPFELCQGGTCVDPCAGINCDEGFECQHGECQQGSCYEIGCEGGKVCADGACMVDDCFGVSCPGTQLCRFGLCEVTCADTVCDDDMRCVQGACVSDACAGVDCADGELCVDGECRPDPCADLQCDVGHLCLDGVCQEDPCVSTACPPGTVCVVTAEGNPDCLYDDGGQVDPDAGVVVPDGGGGGDAGMGPGDPTLTDHGAPSSDGCGCQTPGRSPVGAPLSGLVVLVLVLGALGIRRRGLGRLGLWLTTSLLVVGGPLGCGSDDAATSHVDPPASDAGDVHGAEGSAEVCDGVDNDHDGVIDNIPGLDSDPDNCGACGNVCELANATAFCVGGACRVQRCEAGFVNADGWMDNGCEASCETTAEGVEVCDGLDNDCDGTIDEGFNLNTDTDNCGVCGRSCDVPHVVEVACISARCAIRECEEGFLNLNGDGADGCEVECTPTGNEVCDGLDNDCNGLVDDELEPDPISCFNAGICRGLSRVCRGAEGWICPYPIEYNPDGETRCDGLDEDCDGEIDEDFADLGQPCDGDDADLCEDGIVVCSGDSQGTVCRESGDSVEVCDGVDNDCDGEIDEGFDLLTDDANCGRCNNPCSLNHADGQCLNGVCEVSGCLDGHFDRNANPLDGCEYPCEVTEAGVEVCDGLDNDCDGVVDNDPVPPTLVCNHAGVCANVHPVCDGLNGYVCPYPPSYEPGVELSCDGLDNNCDDAIDEAFGDLGAPCDGDDEDLCTDGVTLCDPNGPGTICSDDALSVVESCDGLDNDCDGEVDEGFDLLTDGTNCGVCGHTCVLDDATSSCVAGTCEIVDCADGHFDRNHNPVDGCEYACEVDNGGVEICDGVDNDCNGVVDDDPVPSVLSCLSVGVCAGAVASCRGASGYACAYPATYEAIEATCDGLDNDCDGEVDETFVGLGAPCDGDDEDACPDGVQICAADGLTTRCSDDPQSISEVCDGLDNDCDGQVDEGIDTETSLTNCGACGVVCQHADGQSECTGGTCVMTGCDAGHVDANHNPVDGCEYACEPDNGGVEICDGLDNDCNRIIDDNPTADGTTCLSQGVCLGVVPLCDGQNGWVCSYPPNYEAGDETTCDGYDNDCDGETDEAYAVSHACDGADADQCADGVNVCNLAGDGVVCTDDAISRAEICDGLDNDCDGAIDEGFDLLTDDNNCGTCSHACNLDHAQSECQSGACVILSCARDYYDSNGAAVDGCEALCEVTNGGLEACDGVDNDCNGAVDDGVVAPDPMMCDNGNGICRGLVPQCQGLSGFHCVFPPAYEAVEVSCDHLDNDCDGLTDEDDDNALLTGNGDPCEDGLGVCLDRGVMVCSTDGSAVVCTASAGAPEPAEICDGLDNDCDGVVDNNIPQADEMVQVTGPNGPVWVDKWEASRPDATSSTAGFNTAYACSRPGVMPWSDLSYDEAQAACSARGKRLCTDGEWTSSCSEAGSWVFPYGDTFDALACNSMSTAEAATGMFPLCTTGTGLEDMSGNLAEWTDCENPVDCQIVKGLFGGAYNDTLDLFYQCDFRNNAAPQFRDQRVGFRCCQD